MLESQLLCYLILLIYIIIYIYKNLNILIDLIFLLTYVSTICFIFFLPYALHRIRIMNDIFIFPNNSDFIFVYIFGNNIVDYLSFFEHDNSIISDFEIYFDDMVKFIIILDTTQILNN